MPAAKVTRQHLYAYLNIMQPFISQVTTPLDTCATICNLTYEQALPGKPTEYP